MFWNKLIKKNNKAQSIVEFALVAPVLILILLFVVEFGYLATARNTVAAASKEAMINSVNKHVNTAGTTQATRTANMETNIRTDVANYLQKRGIPNSSSVTVRITTNANNISVASITYMYRPIFLMQFISSTNGIPLQSSQVINRATVQGNDFNSGLTTAQLSAFGAATSTLTTGGMIGGYAVRDNIAILVSWYDDYDITNVALDSYARLFNWYGLDLLPANERINLRTATIEVRSPYYNGGNWLNTQIPYVWVLAALDYSQVFYTKFNSTVDDVTVPGTGWTLNECTTNNHYDANIADGMLQAGYECPFKWANNNYHYLYRIAPWDYSQIDRNAFNRSLGYRWCNAVGMPACNANQSGFHTIQELSLKGIIRNGVYCNGHALNYSYLITGNSEYTRNTGGTNISYLQHYTARTSDFDNFDDIYTVNLYQPVINNAGSNYYTNANEPVDPQKLILDDANTIDANGNSTPLYSAFQWAFNLNASGIYNRGAAANRDIVDVYIDSDGDGIPDAWDTHPTYFDANANATLDGLEIAVAWNAAANSVLNGLAASATYQFPVPGINQMLMGIDKAQYISTPFYTTGLYMDSKKNNGGLSSLIPMPYYSEFKTLGGILYIQCDIDMDGFDDLCRQYPTWGSAGGTGTVLGDKQRFINGTSNGAVINLNQSSELNYLLNTNNFNGANTVTRTPVGW